VRKCNHGQNIDVGSKTYHIPPGSRVTVLFAGIHSQEQIWGDDVAEFHPDRWPMPASTEKATTLSQSPNNKIPSLTLQPPVKGAFLPWSGGPRVCPGMRWPRADSLQSFLHCLVSIEYKLCRRVESHWKMRRRGCRM
jgi:cytochrome P450